MMKDLYESYIKHCCVSLLLLLMATYAQAAKVAYTIDLTQQSQLDITSKEFRMVERHCLHTME